MNYYSVLGVPKTATRDEIKKAYRNLAKEHHPDRTGGNDEMFKKINEAYETLKDPAKRRNYDNPSQQNRFDTGYTQQWESGNVESFHEFFRDIFGASAGFHHSQYSQPKNKDLRATLEVNLESIFVPQKRTIHLKTGRSEKTIEVDIPAGVNDGAVIRYRGYGQDVLTRVPPGDLFVTIKVNDSNHFKRKSSDLYSSITIDAIDAIIGTTVEFENIDHNKIKVHIPESSQPGQLLRISGKGLPKNNNQNDKGNLYLSIKITVPKLSEDQKNVLKKLRS